MGHTSLDVLPRRSKWEGMSVVRDSKLKEGGFVRAFCDKANHMDGPLSRIPIRVVLNEDAPLLGAAYAAIADELSAEV